MELNEKLIVLSNETTHKKYRNGNISHFKIINKQLISEEEVDADIKDCFKRNKRDLCVILDDNLKLKDIIMDQTRMHFFKTLNLNPFQKLDILINLNPYGSQNKSLTSEEFLEELIKIINNKKLTNVCFKVFYNENPLLFYSIYEKIANNSSEASFIIGNNFPKIKESLNQTEIEYLKALFCRSSCIQNILIEYSSSSKKSSKTIPEYLIQINNKNKQRAIEMIEELLTCEENDYIEMNKPFPLSYQVLN